MQVILDSSFASPGSAPIWGGKKGEFRDWTRPYEVVTSVVHIVSLGLIRIGRAFHLTDYCKD